MYTPEQAIETAVNHLSVEGWTAVVDMIKWITVGIEQLQSVMDTIVCLLAVVFLWQRRCESAFVRKAKGQGACGLGRRFKCPFAYLILLDEADKRGPLHLDRLACLVVERDHKMEKVALPQIGRRLLLVVSAAQTHAAEGALVDNGACDQSRFNQVGCPLTSRRPLGQA